jgi:hypothetical protein
MDTTWSAHLMLLDLISLIFGEAYYLQSSSLCSFFFRIWNSPILPMPYIRVWNLLDTQSIHSHPFRLYSEGVQ